MTAKITIKNIKSISFLEFEVPSHGAFILTGMNGCGKTSLLVTLHRMRNNHAFQLGFPAAGKSQGLDRLDEARIEYEINNKNVSYRYNNTRWSATPKSHSNLVKQAYTDVQFFKADSSRVEPITTDPRAVIKKPADKELIDFLNNVFDTKKFDNLLKINLRGKNSTAHLIELPAEGGIRSFYSEKHFSLGELCVLRLAIRLLGVKTGGLYIVDEFEMALHPAAQIRLFREIEKLIKSKNCTALVSTHSSSLIKSVKRSSIIYLDNQNGVVSVQRNVYPTYALQSLALDEESAPDKIILVEDISAKYCVTAMWQHHIRSNKVSHTLPEMRVVIIGGYTEVLRFLSRSSSITASNTKCMAALDEDAKDMCVRPAAKNGITTIPTDTNLLYESQINDVVFLPWTPEVGVCDLIASDPARQLVKLSTFANCKIHMELKTLTIHKTLTPKAGRTHCKHVVSELAGKIVSKLKCSEDRAFEYIFSYLVEEAGGTTPMKVLKSKLFG